MADPTPNGRLDVIGRYLTRGWALVPLHPMIGIDDAWVCGCGRPECDESAGKHPIAREWQHNPVRDLAGLPARCNVGIATGAASGIWVLDVDPGHGGDETMAALVVRHGDLPATYTVRTGSGGTHLYWTLPADAGRWLTTARRIGPGVDTRGEGGQVVAPPSVSGKGAYQILRDVEVVPAPDWLVEILRPASRPSTVSREAGLPQTPAPGGANGDRSAAYAAAALARVCDELAEAVEGTRNTVAFETACRLVELVNAGWVALDAAYGAYREAAAVADERGTGRFSEAEARGVWGSAARRVGDKAAVLPPSEFGGELLPFGTATTGTSSASTLTIFDPSSGGAGVPEYYGTQSGTLVSSGNGNAVTAHGTGWVAVDLTAVLAGETRSVTPELGTRNDGQSVLYRGKEHTVASEPECGKTWWLAYQAVAILQAGGRVVWVDFEDDEYTVVGQRILALGIMADRLGADAQRFRFARPEAPYAPGELGALLRFDDGVPADLVVYDGITEGMGQFGLDPLAQKDAVRWRAWMIKPALMLGCATISSDHVVKKEDDRGRYAIGAQHKLAGLNGAAFLMESVEPFGRGMRGKSRVLVAKDRNGALRQHGQPTDAPGITHVGDLVGDATSGEMKSLVFWPPMTDERREQAAGARVLAVARAALDAIQAAERPLGVRDIRARVRGNRNQVIDEAIAWLESGGYIQVESSARGGRLHHYVSRPDDWV